MTLTSNFLFQLFTVCDTRKLFLFCRLVTSQSFYLRQKLRGDRRYAAKAKTSLFGAKLSTRLRFLPCNFLRFFKEPNALLLAVHKFNLNRIQYTPIDC